MPKDNKTPIVKPPELTAERLDLLRRFFAILEGKNPDIEQSLNDFMDLKDVTERTRLPTRKDVVRIAYLNYAGSTYWPDDPNNPFTDAAVKMSKAFMGYQGWKAEQFVKLFQQVPDAVALETNIVAKAKGVVDRFIGGDSSI